MRIGIDLGGTNLRVGVVNERGRVVSRETVPTPAEADPGATIEAMAAIIRQFGRPTRVGIGAPGIIDHDRGIVRTSPNLPRWKNVPLRARLEKLVRSPVKVANDVNAMAWGEHLFGAGRGSRDILCITLGTGLGGAVILDGKLHIGKDHSAGEIGHVVVVPGGRKCACGNLGCVERYVAKHGIVHSAERARPGREHTPETVAVEAARGRKWAVEVYDDAAAHLALVLSGVIQILNIEKIIIGGQIAKAGRVLFTPLKKHIDRHVYPMLRKSYRIERAALGGDGGIVGAAFL